MLLNKEYINVGLKCQRFISSEKVVIKGLYIE